MGTPEFAVASLDMLVKNNMNVVGVVTAPDKPAGRGMKIRFSPVKVYALKNELQLFQPEKLKNPDFIEQLKILQPDLFVVVAFRMLPEIIWKMPKYGTFNLHASLLPQYRGAAPIHWAVINGEKETGVTTFFINENIDTGNIIFKEKISIGEEETTGSVHDHLMTIGADLVLKTVLAVQDNQIVSTVQVELIKDSSELKPAPKLFKVDCKINWNNDIQNIFNRIRGLSPFPTAYTELGSPDGQQFLLKIYSCQKEISVHKIAPGTIQTDRKTFLKVAVTNGYILINELQLEGRKKMFVAEFLRGFPIDNSWKTK